MASHAIRIVHGQRIISDLSLRSGPYIKKDYSWMDEAACKGMGTELFFPACGEPTRKGKSICAKCPVREQCRQEALSDPTIRGIWGGTSEEERRMERVR